MSEQIVEINAKPFWEIGAAWLIHQTMLLHT